MKIANRLNSEVAVIIGETESENNTATIKFMNASKNDQNTKTINRNDIVNFIKYNI